MLTWRSERAPPHSAFREVNTSSRLGIAARVARDVADGRQRQHRIPWRGLGLGCSIRHGRRLARVCAPRLRSGRRLIAPGRLTHAPRARRPSDPTFRALCKVTAYAYCVRIPACRTCCHRSSNAGLPSSSAVVRDTPRSNPGRLPARKSASMSSCSVYAVDDPSAHRTV